MYQKTQQLSLFSSGFSKALESPSQLREAFPHPTLRRSDFESRNSVYEQQFAYYSNTAFDQLTDWIKYRREYGLYKYIRGIFNPVTRLVDFYAEHVYPGSITEDGEQFNGVTRSIPLAHNTPEELEVAVEQSWNWSNWQCKQALLVTYGALNGNCLVEIIDDVDKGKIGYKIIWAGYVKDFELDDYGDLTYYALEYPIFNRDYRVYQSYGKEVTLNTISIYIDGILFETRENPYGVIPAIWVKHFDIGSDFGVNAIKSSITKIDELNSMTSHTIDHVHKQIRSPRLVWTNSTVKSLFRDGQDADDSDVDVRGELTLLKGAQGGNTETLVGALDPATIVPMVHEINKELEKDFPEIAFYEKLRDQNIVSSPGAKLMMGDVEKKLRRSAANYDIASQKLFSLGVAIAGFRANQPAREGGWIGKTGKLTKAQEIFKPFNLDQLHSGELEVKILPRPLVQESSREEAEQLQLRGQGLASLDGVIPRAEKLKWLGYKDEEIPAIIEALDEEEAAKQEAAITELEQQAALSVKSSERNKNTTVSGNGKSSSKITSKKSNSSLA